MKTPSTVGAPARRRLGRRQMMALLGTAAAWPLGFAVYRFFEQAPVRREIDRWPGLMVRDLRFGRPRQLTASADQWRLVNFWATWCEPCRRELPSLVSLARSFQADGLKVEGVALEKDRFAVLEYIERRAPGWNSWLALPDEPEVLALNVGALPQTWLIDPQGRIAARWVGEKAWGRDDLQADIRERMRGTGKG